MTTANCPKCEGVDLARARDKSVPVWECPACRGMWLMPGEAELLSSSGTAAQHAVARLPADKKGGACPFGHGHLDRARVDVEDGGDAFYLDRCLACSGVFFDDGEWGRLARSHLLRHLDDLWDPLFQQRLDHERSDKRWRADLVEKLGDDIVGTLEDLAAKIATGDRLSEALAWLTARVDAHKRALSSAVADKPRRERRVDGVLLHFVRADTRLEDYVPESLADVGFVHLCHRNQAVEVRARHFPPLTDLVALVFDPAQLLSPVKEEETGHGVFPHLYGPLRTDAVRTSVFLPGAASGDEVLRLLDDAIEVGAA